MSTLAYRNPTEIERSFLRVVTRGYRHLSSQIENCRIADYDVVGFCYAKVAHSRDELRAIERERDTDLSPHERTEAIFELTCSLAARGTDEFNSDLIDLLRA